jgi:uncharacterized protein (TIGR00730 family)
MIQKVIEKTNDLKEELLKDEFRVTIFGSARTSKDDPLYGQIFDLAKEIAENGIDLVTGGGPGVMEAANAGHMAGDKDNNSDSIGLTIELPWENEGNDYLELQKAFPKFSGRLDHFMALSTAVVVMPGGVGTCLELFYTWQLVQVKHIRPLPIILVGDMWQELLTWVKSFLIKDKLISPSDIDYLHVAKDNAEVMQILLDYQNIFEQQGDQYYSKIERYQVS